MIIGNGLNADIWKDDWTGLGSLREAFPSIFALLVLKQRPVANFGSWNQEKWAWGVTLIRQPLDWEIHI